MTPGPDCTKLVQEFEGCAKKQPDGTFAAYPDPGSGGDPWTIGWGSTGPDIKKGVVWTQKQCDDRFTEHLARIRREGEQSARQHAHHPAASSMRW